MLFGGMGRLSENSVINIKNKSHAVTADLTVADRRRGRRDHRPGRPLRRLGPLRPRRQAGLLLQPARRPAVQDLRRHRRSRPATTRCGWSSPTTAAASARAATVTLYIDGDPAGQGRVDATQPMIFSADETTDLGSDSATPVSDDYDPDTSTFTGRVRWVQIDLGADAEDADHLITPEERYRIAVAIQ